MVKYQYEIRKYFTSKLYVVFASISTKTSTRNRTNYSRGRLRETPRSFCGGTGSERSVFDLFQSKGKSSEPAPDHATIARFRSIHFSPVAEKYLSLTVNYLMELGEISGNEIFIDGTKIKANANKYTFVCTSA